MYEIRKIGVVSLAKVTSIISAVTYGIAMLLMGAIWLPLITSFSGSYRSSNDWGDFLPMIIGIPAGAIIGFIVGAASALIYNVFAKHFGGVKLDIALVSDGESSDQPVNIQPPNPPNPPTR